MANTLETLSNGMLCAPDGSDMGDVVPLALRPGIGAPTIGLMRPHLLDFFASLPQWFTVSQGGVTLRSDLSHPRARSEALADLVDCLRAGGAIGPSRDELFDVRADWDGPVLAQIDRSAVRALGIRVHKVHLLASVTGRGGQSEVWLGRRSADRRASPNHLDTTVAGGRASGYSVHETLIKESEEEAGFQASRVASASPAGRLTYCMPNGQAIRWERLHIFEIELASGIEPVNMDGEVSGFERVDHEELLHRLTGGDLFKPGAALVCFEYLRRHHGALGLHYPALHRKMTSALAA